MNPSRPTILFTGGGSAGHVTPNLPLIHQFKKANWDVHYMGSTQGIEKHIIEKEKIPYHGILSGKLRRYFSWQNFIDPFKILLGIFQSLYTLKKINPCVIFSKGGFVAFPVVFAAKLLGISTIVHESDLTPGLANKLCFPFAQTICLTFPETLQFIQKFKHKAQVTGFPLREEALNLNPHKAREKYALSDEKPLLFIYGGSLGSTLINQTVRQILPELLNTFQIIHLCGQGKVSSALKQQKGYLQIEYLHEGFYDLLACADLVISRSGSNSLCELLILNKPHILIPLSRKASRGEQIVNARYSEKRGMSMVVQEEELNKDRLLEAINQASKNGAQLTQAMKQNTLKNGTQAVFELLQKLVSA